MNKFIYNFNTKCQNVITVLKTFLNIPNDHHMTSHTDIAYSNKVARHKPNRDKNQLFSDKMI